MKPFILLKFLVFDKGLSNRRWEIFMRQCLVIAVYCLTIQNTLSATTGTISINAYCRCLEVQVDVRGIVRDLGGNLLGNVFVSVTTYDGASGLPLGLSSINGSFNNSGELRPRLSQAGLFEADFVSYEGNSV